MAALPDAPLSELIELPQLPVNALEPLFDEEIAIWDKRFTWDFRPSADLLRRFLQMQSLNGCALRCGSEVVGYAYHVCEGHKGLIGDFYVRASHSSSSNEMLLLGSIVRTLMLIPGIRRVESQLMLLNTPLAQPLPFQKYLVRHDRYFMQIDGASAMRLPNKTAAFRATFPTWAERFQEEIARVVASSYKGHVDSEINDQYRTISGARHFLMNIVKFPGCGRFSPAASVVAIDESTGHDDDAEAPRRTTRQVRTQGDCMSDATERCAQTAGVIAAGRDGAKPRPARGEAPGGTRTIYLAPPPTTTPTPTASPSPTTQTQPQPRPAAVPAST